MSPFRSLGAPQVLELGDGQLRWWKTVATGQPILLETVASDDVEQFFYDHRTEWKPSSILRGKNLGRQQIIGQLDFFDLGLMPLLDRQVRAKLDSLLEDALSIAVRAQKLTTSFSDDDYPALFKMLFRLVAAKVLGDREDAEKWIKDDPADVIRQIEDFYFPDTKLEPILVAREAQIAAWERIRSSFHFQNISVDALAYVYENTLVSQETRRLYGTHSTPPEIAQYIVDQLPWEELAESDRKVFEPFSGHAVFLVAAMRKLRELLDPTVPSDQRHKYFVDMLHGIELDDFAGEVARLSLMLADYPNPDGWHLIQGDAFADDAISADLNAAQIVLCNPPFEDFTAEEQRQYTNLRSKRKSAEILLRVLDNPPKMLGFVLPRIFIDGTGFRKVREKLMDSYSRIHVVALPDKTFRHSDVESALLIASESPSDKIQLTTGGVREGKLGDFYSTATPSYMQTRSVDASSRSYRDRLWLPELLEVWEALSYSERLNDIADIHRGFQFSLSLKEHADELVSEHPRPGFVPGLYRQKGVLEPYNKRGSVYLNITEQVVYGRTHTLPWADPKVILNRVRRSRGPWAIVAALDYRGLFCYQDFHGVWPKGDVSIEVLAAVLNGPVANAFVATSEGKRDVKVKTIRNVPVPMFQPGQIGNIDALVTEYSRMRRLWLAEEIAPEEAAGECKRLLNMIDGELLKAYNLSPRLERMLLDYFQGQQRPGPVDFTEYFPSSFKPFIPWHAYNSDEIRRAAASATIERLPIITDPAVSEALADLEV